MSTRSVQPAAVFVLTASVHKTIVIVSVLTARLLLFTARAVFSVWEGAHERRSTHMRVPILFVVLLCAMPPYAVEAQFGSLQVDWSAGGSASVSDGTQPKPDANLVPGEARRTNLWELVERQPEQLKTIVESFQVGGCDACQSAGHWVAKVRSATACGRHRLASHLSTPISAFLRSGRASSRCARREYERSC